MVELCKIYFLSYSILYLLKFLQLIHTTSFDNQNAKIKINKIPQTQIYDTCRKKINGSDSNFESFLCNGVLC